MESRLNKILVAVCDDCIEDRTQLVNYIAQFFDTQEIYAEICEFSTGEALLEEQRTIQLVFLDIIMKGITGMTVAKELVRRNRQTKIVFVSSSIDYAAESYEVGALYYLIKPIQGGQLDTVLNRYMEFNFGIRTIPIRVGRLKEQVYLADLIYAETSGRQCTLHLKNGIISTTMSLAEVIELLPKEDFRKPIRYAVVSLREITHIGQDIVQLSDGSSLPLSRRERKEFQTQYMNFRWKELRAWHTQL